MFSILIRKFKTLCKIAYINICVNYRTYRFKIFKFIGITKVNCPSSIKIKQKLTFCGYGELTIGDNTEIGVYPSPGFDGEFYLEARNKLAKITIGKNVIINNGARIIADGSSISIGDNTIIGGNFFCVDSHFHKLTPEDRLNGSYTCKDVSIGRNVFIGESVMILRGVSIGDNSVIGAGCVINNDIPSNVIVSRNNDLKITEIKRD